MFVTNIFLYILSNISPVSVLAAITLRSAYPESKRRGNEEVVLKRNEKRHGSAITRRTLIAEYDVWQRVAPFCDPIYYALAAPGSLMGYWKALAQCQKDEFTELRLRRGHSWN